MLWSPPIMCHPTSQFHTILLLKCCFLNTLDTLFSLSSIIIFSIVTFTMWEMSSRRVNSLKLMVRCRRAVRWEISFILHRLLPWRFSTWRLNTLKIEDWSLLWAYEMASKSSCLLEKPEYLQWSDWGHWLWPHWAEFCHPSSTTWAVVLAQVPCWGLPCLGWYRWREYHLGLCSGSAMQIALDPSNNISKGLKHVNCPVGT